MTLLVQLQSPPPNYRGLEKRYLRSLISSSRWFESSIRNQIMEMWQSPVYCNSLENCRVERHREFESHRFRQSCLLKFNYTGERELGTKSTNY